MGNSSARARPQKRSEVYHERDGAVETEGGERPTLRPGAYLDANRLSPRDIPGWLRHSVSLALRESWPVASSSLALQERAGGSHLGLNVGGGRGQEPSFVFWYQKTGKGQNDAKNSATATPSSAKQAKGESGRVRQRKVVITTWSPLKKSGLKT